MHGVRTLPWVSVMPCLTSVSECECMRDVMRVFFLAASGTWRGLVHCDTCKYTCMCV